MDDIERILSGDVLSSATRTSAGTELVFPYPQVEQAIQQASAHMIAVLGVEVNVYGAGYRYVLTTSSRDELAAARLKFR